MKHLPKLIVILGTTATGKTKLALELCKKFNGEVISADSRQVYKYMKIGTDTPDGTWKTENGIKTYFVDGVAHHLMDCIKPDYNFSLADFKTKAEELIYDINKRGKIPFLVGGTGMYISSIIQNWSIPNVLPDKKLRQKLEQKPLEELVKILKEKDPRSAKIIDLKNPRRVLRALEVATQSGQSFIEQKKKDLPKFNFLQIGLQREREEIYQRINSRIDEMMKEGLIEEIKQLLTKGYGWGLPSMSSLGYRQFKDYLAGQQTLEEAVEIFKRDTRHYAKRQITWFKRDKSINWVEANDASSTKKLIDDFLL